MHFDHNLARVLYADPRNWAHIHCTCRYLENAVRLTNHTDNLITIQHTFFVWLKGYLLPRSRWDIVVSTRLAFSAFIRPSDEYLSHNCARYEWFAATTYYIRTILYRPLACTSLMPFVGPVLRPYLLTRTFLFGSTIRLNQLMVLRGSCC